MNIYIVGPTASGKTNVSIDLALQLSSEIISADSRQCYKYLDIGTAKPNPSQLATVKHYNVSLFEPTYKDNAERFTQRTIEWMSNSESKHWIVCGGSTLYIQSLLFPLDKLPSSDAAIQEALLQELSLYGIQRLYDELVKSDPIYSKQMDGMNTQRILRALNIIRQTNLPFSSFHQRSEFSLPTNTIVFYLHWDRNVLVKRIAERVEHMMSAGLVEEVKQLLDAGYNEHTFALNTVGYKEVFGYLRGETSHSEMKEQIIINTARYAKRQKTWFKRYPFLNWIDVNERSSPVKTIKDTIDQFSKA
jgi:tRNA dimethylallyltransferase